MSNHAAAIAIAPSAGAAEPDDLALTLERCLKAWRFAFDVEDELRALQARNHVAGVHNIEIAPHAGFWQERRRLGESLIEDLVAGMKRAFLPAGFDLSVSTYELSDRQASVRVDEDREGAFLRYAERRLREKYQGSGTQLALAQAAVDIWHGFSLDQRAEVKQGPGGAVVLSQSVWCERGIGKEPRRITFNTASRTGRLWHSLDAFLAHAGRPRILPTSPRDLLHRFQFSHLGGIASRGTYRLTDGITLVTYYERFEYRFDPALAAELQVFLAEHRPARDE